MKFVTNQHSSTDVQLFHRIDPSYVSNSDSECGMLRFPLANGSVTDFEYMLEECCGEQETTVAGVHRKKKVPWRKFQSQDIFLKVE